MRSKTESKLAGVPAAAQSETTRIASRRSPLNRPAAKPSEREPVVPSVSSYNEPASVDSDLLENLQDPASLRTLSVKEAAYRLRKSPDAIYSWLRRGRLKAWQPGGPGCAIHVIEASVERAMQFSVGRA